MTLGQYIKQLRQQRALSQPQLASQMTVEQSYLSKLENDHSIPSNEVFRKLLAALDLDLGSFMQGVAEQGDKQSLTQIPDIEAWYQNLDKHKLARRRSWILMALVCISLGCALFYSGYRALFLPERQYEYHSYGELRDDEPLDLYTRWHRYVSDADKQNRADYDALRLMYQKRQAPELLYSFDYRGSAFVVQVDNGRRYFEVQPERVHHVSRPGNAWMQFIGIVLFVAGLLALLLERRYARAH
ncbi:MULTISPECIES: helix-turn-helix transcriptional regulator [unclassified Pseudoalteromonas]|uniref:helix-turn-helix domain-containing protein n=1 Tax=unclassified Pseudoalteromonas TaxID=194690 RepID=UPI002097F356|nr:helix-turn-helix transcriptional regulator [Pseudoalteromonas sp. XMcav2-N]MCO7190183.1 helix-turn-helix domain-containing protein [Pseudoalteromonas sp. XMcav2-N]